MFRKSWFCLICALVIVSFALVGCGSNAPATPTTKAVPTQAPVVVTVVITVTPVPATATSAATLTPIPTLAATVPASPTVKATTVSGPPKPTATKKPTTPAVTPTNTAVPLKYAAPKLVGPIYDLALGRKDERHYPGDALIFQWQSVGNLGPSECYMIRVDMNPGQGDAFLQCDPAKATQLTAGATAQFMLNQPNRGGPNYSSLLPTTVGDTTVNWYVQVVRDDGKGNGPTDPSGGRHAVTPLSPKSNTAMFLLKGS